MEIIIDLDPLTAHRLTWLMLINETGKWCQPVDILRPLILAEWSRMQQVEAEKNAASLTDN